jgi:uncharacterized protein involved in response to NO
MDTASWNRKENAVSPLLTAGFRPFFLAAATWSVLALALWLALSAGDADLPSRFAPLTWHIHEMLFGFVMAAIAGFLLTAIPNWTNRAPMAGTPLAVLAVLWLLGRLACLFSALSPVWLAPVVDLAFPLALEAVAARELIAAGNRRNYPLLTPLIVLALANMLMHLQALGVAVPAGLGWRLGIAAVIVLISVIGGRIIPAFTRNWLRMHHISDAAPAPAILNRIALATLHAGMIGWAFLPDSAPAGVLLVAAAVANAARLSGWRGAAARAEPLLVILHVGYSWLVAGAALLGLSLLSGAVPLAAAVHALTAGAMGTMILAVTTRATLGHTGHALHADAATIAIFALVSVSAALRVIAAWPIGAQWGVIAIAGVAWIGAFALFLVRYGPVLLAART